MNTNNEFNSLEFNLYELLNVPTDCTNEEIRKSFRRIIKKFHPDKISAIEEKLYYNITYAHHILSNPTTRVKYNNWLLNSNKQHSQLKDNFKNEEKTIREYFPQTKEEAAVDFSKQFDILSKRHGEYKEDERNLNSIIKEKEKERVKVEIKKEDFSSMDDFNSTFSQRKKNGTYNNMIIKKENNIQPFTFKNNNYAELKHFNDVYVKDTQYKYAFELLPENEKRDINRNLSKGMDEYKKNTMNLNNNKMQLNFNDLDF
jgi:curved DNA-binding protein CbpA